MSFDIWFWRYQRGLDRDHVAVCHALARGEDVAGLAPIDTEAMIDALAGLMSGWERVDDTSWEKPGKAYLNAEAAPHYLCLQMSHAASRQILLKIATPMRRMGCGLWNPQMNKRLAAYDEDAGDEGS